MSAVGSRLVLIVEDDKDTREALGELIRTGDYEVLAAATQNEARAYLAQGITPHAITLDGNVPVTAPLDGQPTSTVGLARWFREQGFSGLIVALPGSQKRLDDLIAVATSGGPAVGFLKPVDPDRLWAALDRQS